jgi:hypothetical protein
MSGLEAFHGLFGELQIRACRLQRVTRNTRPDPQFSLAARKLDQRPHITGDDLVMLR